MTTTDEAKLKKYSPRIRSSEQIQSLPEIMKLTPPEYEPKYEPKERKPVNLSRDLLEQKTQQVMEWLRAQAGRLVSLDVNNKWRPYR